MKLYTKTGDQGETSLFGGSRVAKDDIKVWAYGTIDELSSYLGLVFSYLEDSRKDIIKHIQKNCFIIGAELSSDEKGLSLLKERITETQVTELESLIDTFQAKTNNIKDFTYPGKNVLSAHIHISRTICRKAERYVVSLRGYENIIKYLNRLSDLLYIMAEGA